MDARRFAMDDIQNALRYLGGGEHFGKVVVDVGPSR
jgi:hypothetical protein